MINIRTVPPLLVALGFCAAPAWGQSSLTIDTAPPAVQPYSAGD